jgi:amidase
MVPIAGGGDGGGSIRIPASCCGVFGLKPTRARTPSGPHLGALWQGSVVEHVLTRSVRDSAAMLDAIAGPDVGAPYYPPSPARAYLDEVATPPGRLRVAVTDRPFFGRSSAPVDPECTRAIRETAALLESLGHHVEEAVPDVDGPTMARAFLTMICAEVRADLTDAERAVGRRARARDLEPATWALALLGGRIAAGEYVTAVRTLERGARRAAALFERYDVLMTPTVAAPPVEIGSLMPPWGEMLALRIVGRLRAAGILEWAGALEQSARKTFDFIPYTPLFNITGQPAMSVPLAWSAGGLPIGIQFVGRYADEATLFRLAGELERTRPWFDRNPPIFG